MYNPLPFLPLSYRRIIFKLKTLKISPRIIFFVMGVLATVWFLIRVIPKPSRANYPCMKATAPFMSAFIIYLLSLGGAFLAIKKFRSLILNSRFIFAFFFLTLAVTLYLFSNTLFNTKSYSVETVKGKGIFTPNAPIGVAQGIFPGRVVWTWDPYATNETCTNTSNNNGVIDIGDDGWFMAANNNSQVIDSMVINSLIALTGASDNADAWDKIFRFYNVKSGHGNVGYSSGEIVFIKINATTAYGGIADNRFHADLSRTDDISVNPFSAETNPYIVLAMLRQLVNIAQVPQNCIYIGDPARNIYKEFYDMWHSEFPDVNYFGNNLIHPEINVAALGRTPVVVTADDKVFFSDHGTVMTGAVTDKLFTIFDEMDYLINIPTMKAHATAGISVAAKNHFGSFTRTWAMQLHPGLFDNNDDPVRLGYGLYRVQTDIMMHKLLSGKNLLILVDALYPSEDAGAVPYKWESPPFYNDWCSSIFTSLDPVAIESVCHDFLRTEYNGPTIAESRPNWNGVDDYLHQAADSSLWPENIVYDPDTDGIVFASLGVHEHWNDSLDKQYTRNLGTGNGIELYKVHETVINSDKTGGPEVTVYPNPVKDIFRIINYGNSDYDFVLFDIKGEKLLSGTLDKRSVEQVSILGIKNGVYLLCIRNQKEQKIIKVIIQK